MPINLGQFGVPKTFGPHSGPQLSSDGQQFVHDAAPAATTPVAAITVPGQWRLLYFEFKPRREEIA